MFKKRCHESGFMSKKDPTHVLMDGGNLSVPFDRLNEFYSIYIQSIESNESISVVEKKTPIYNFFMDIDYVSESQLELGELYDILGVIGKCIMGQCVVSIAKPKMKDDKVKTGIHINWHGLHVEQETALEYRSKVIKGLYKHDPMKNWDAIIDESVYKGSGLRMLWSRKFVRKTNTWEIEYLPILQGRGGEFKHIADSGVTIELLRETSIRVETHKQAQPKKTKEAPPPPPNLVDLQRYINTHMPGHEHARVIRVDPVDMRKAIVISDAKWCESIKDKHKSNHVYFVIDGRSIHQRCHDEECKKRTKGIVGREYILPQRIFDIIFSISK